MSALKPCPFPVCGKQPRLVKALARSGGRIWWVVCDCGAEGPDARSREDAIAVWNAASRREEDNDASK